MSFPERSLKVTVSVGLMLAVISSGVFVGNLWRQFIELRASHDKLATRVEYINTRIDRVVTNAEQELGHEIDDVIDDVKELKELVEEETGYHHHHER